MKTIDSKILFKNPWWEYKLDNYSLKNGVKSEYHYVSTYGSTFVVPKLENGNFLMVKQERYLNKKLSLEFPGGGQKKELSKLENIKNELLEETGLIGNNFIELGVFNPYIGITNENCTIFYCDNYSLGKKQLEETEIINSVEMSEDEIDFAMKNGEIWSGISIVAWYLYKLKRKELC